MPATKFTPEKAYRALQLTSEGHSNVEVGKRLKVSGDTVARWLTRLEEDPDLMKQVKSTAKKKAKKKKVPKKKAKTSNGKTKQPQNGEKKEAIRKWMAAHPQGTYRDFLEDTGISTINANYFHIVRHQVRKEPPINGDDVSSMKDRISFLEWWNEGERKGFVDRLLSEI
jgi:transposase